MYDQYVHWHKLLVEFAKKIGKPDPEVDPAEYIERENLDFSKITASQFEELCKVILSVLGFRNIISRGQTNSPDGGVDIECDEDINQIFGVKVRHWIFQCKNAKKWTGRI